MAIDQNSNCQEKYNNELYQRTQTCECGYEISKKCKTNFPLLDCPECNRKLCISTIAMSNDFTRLGFTSEENKSGWLLNQVNNVQHEKSNVVKTLMSKPIISNGPYNNSNQSHIQTIYSPNIDLSHDITNNKQYANKIGLVEDLPSQVMCLTIMCILLVLLSYCGVLSFIELSNCPGEENIPLYLMVECFCGILLILQISTCIFTNNFSYFHMFICVLCLVFQLAWSVPGYLWIYGYSYDQLNVTSSEYFCDYRLYTTAYWVLNCSSLINGLIFTCLCVYLIMISKPSLGIIDVVMGTMISIFIAMIISGFLKSGSCPFNMYLPVYVTVTGICGLLCSSYIFRTLRSGKSQNNKNYFLIDKTGDNADEREYVNKCDIITYVSYGLFQLAWFSIGCNLVLLSETPEFVELNIKYCDHTFYMFIYIILSIISLIIGTVLICLFSLIFMFIFALFCTFLYII